MILKPALILASILMLATPFSRCQEFLFDMEQIRDAASLKTEVIAHWHLVEAEPPTRQKLMTISVGELWPGQDYRVPVRLIVPAQSSASGFHLTAGHSLQEFENDIELNPLEKALISGGVGLVHTMVQEPGAMGQKELGEDMYRRFIETLNPHYSIQYWGWPATFMRAITAAYAEKEYFKKGKIAVSGASKNGASPSVSIICDDRITAQHSIVAPIWDSPLRLCERDAWDELEKEQPSSHYFLGGTFGPVYNRDALEAGHSWEELQALANQVADQIFISRNLEQLARRDVDMLFHPGTHDFVAFDLPWGGAHFPQIPVFLEANSGHGFRESLPVGEKRQQNLPAFLLGHFFDHADPMLEPPLLEYKVNGTTLSVTVKFKPGSQEESGRIFWMYNRAREGTEAYLKELFPVDLWRDMKFDDVISAWTINIEIPSHASHIDFFSTHGKTVDRNSKKFQTYISSPYTRVTF